MKQERDNNKFQEFRDLVDALARCSFDRVSRRYYRYISNRYKLGSKENTKVTKSQLAQSRLVETKPLKADYYTSNEYQLVSKYNFEYMSAMLSEYMYRRMPTLSITKIKNRFLGKTTEEINEDYEKHFKRLFVKLVLDILGGRSVTQEDLVTRKKKADIASQRAKWELEGEVLEQMEYSLKAEILGKVEELIKELGLKSGINLQSLYMSNDKVDYLMRDSVVKSEDGLVFEL